MRKVKAKIQRIINNYFYNKINKCKKCGSKGCLTKYYNQWHIICLGKCTNCTELHKTRLGAIKEWNEQDPQKVCMECANRLLTEYEQKIRADAINELPTQLYYDGWNDGYKQGRANAIEEVIYVLKHRSTTMLENGYEYHGYDDDELEEIAEQLKEQNNE